MSNQGPIAALREWLQSQPDDARHELALHVAYPLFPVPSTVIADKHQCLQLVLDWLDDTQPRNLQLGRILSFSACLDYLMRYRDTDEKWDATEAQTKRILGSMPADTAAHGADLLETLPARRAQWIALAADWYKLRDSIFEGKHLDAWLMKG